jgi:2-oxo-4-hydroxy-4-carboxy-5-ureidoimidazoline decarboxylase
MMRLREVNKLSPAAFVEQFGDVAEHSSWVARIVETHRPFADRDAMVHAFTTAMRAAPHDKQLALVRAHPDLATQAKLSEDSTHEQAGAGLSSLTPAEFARFTDLNHSYKERFNFPFIFAVRGASKEQILASFDQRVDNDVAVEFATALAQVCRIFRFRIEERVQD